MLLVVISPNMTAVDNLKLECRKEIVITLLVIIALGASVNFLIFGFANVISFSDYRNYLLFPSLFTVFFISIYWYKKNKKLAKTLAVGLLIGLIATAALEAIRIPNVYIHWIPHDDMIALPGKLLLDTNIKSSDLMMQDAKIIPQTKENENLHESEHDTMHDKANMDHSMQSTIPELVAGGLYHFWNGATMAAVYALIVGKGRWYFGLIWGFIVHIGMMLAPWMLAMVGPFGINYDSGYTIFTASLFAHLAYGIVIGVLAKKYLNEKSPLLALLGRR